MLPFSNENRKVQGSNSENEKILIVLPFESLSNLSIKIQLKDFYQLIINE